MTKAAFLSALSAQLPEKYEWAKDPARLARFMEAVASTINRPAGGGPWHHEGEASTAAWRVIGGKGKPTLKALRALAD